ncbi:MAG: methionyl-tRNA formyltransferase [Planctomycetia bacterium]
MTPSSDRPLRIVVMGTGPFAVPMFRGLLASRHTIVAVVTRPVRVAPGRRPPANPMRDAAEAAGLPILDPADINAPEAVATLAAVAPDLLVVCDYGQILAPATLATAPYGGVNLHGSLLPRHRGAAPVQWAILAGDPVTGVSVIHMTPALDAGNVLVTRETVVAGDETAAALEERLAALGGEAVAEAIGLLVAAGPGARPGTPQDPARVTRAPRLAKADGLVDWSRTATQIERMRRALEPWPRTSTFLHTVGRPPLLVVLDDVAVAEADAGGIAASTAAHAAGRILRADAAGIVVACGEGTRLVVRSLVPEGKRSMSAADFRRGHPLADTARLG